MAGRKRRAEEIAEALDQFDRLVVGGMGRNKAAEAVAKKADCNISCVYAWLKRRAVLASIPAARTGTSPVPTKKKYSGDGAATTTAATEPPAVADDAEYVTLRVKRVYVKTMLEEADDAVKQAAKDFCDGKASVTHKIVEAVKEYLRMREAFSAGAVAEK